MRAAGNVSGKGHQATAGRWPSSSTGGARPASRIGRERSEVAFAFTALHYLRGRADANSVHLGRIHRVGPRLRLVCVATLGDLLLALLDLLVLDAEQLDDGLLLVLHTVVVRRQYLETSAGVVVESQAKAQGG